VGEQVKLSKLEFPDQMVSKGCGRGSQAGNLQFESEEQVNKPWELLLLLLLLQDCQMRNTLTGRFYQNF
jgi:hypothetical protein